MTPAWISCELQNRWFCPRLLSGWFRDPLAERVCDEFPNCQIERRNAITDPRRSPKFSIWPTVDSKWWLSAQVSLYESRSESASLAVDSRAGGHFCSRDADPRQFRDWTCKSERHLKHRQA